MHRDLKFLLIVIVSLLIAWKYVSVANNINQVMFVLDYSFAKNDELTEWRVGKRNWKKKAEAFFRSIDKGSWKYDNLSVIQFMTKENITLPRISKEDIEQCFQSKWIMMRGDSSLRFLFSSIIQYLGGPAITRDPYMPKYESCNESDCNRFFSGRYNNHSDPGGVPEYYFREYWNANKSTRITFCFSRFFEEKSIITEQFITDSMQPDILILEAGPWDKMTYNDTADESIHKMRILIKDVHRYYKGPVIWTDLIACAYEEWTAEFSSKSHAIAGIPTMSRHKTTTNLPDELLPLCNGWHGHGQLSDLHRDMIFYALCRV